MADTSGLRPDIARAKGRAGFTIGGGREIKALESHLWEGETVEHMAAGQYGGGTGLLTLTDRRLLFTKDGVMAKQSEDFPLSKISSVQWKSGMAMGTVTIFVSGNKAEIKNVPKGPGKVITDSVRNSISAPPAAQAPPPAPMSTPAPPPMRSTTPPPPPGTPADWLPDPTGRFVHRYWDGTRWTEHVHDGTQQTTDQP
jgi:hypothetical protein